MAKTTEKDKTASATVQEAPAAQLPATMRTRLPYPRTMQEWAGYSQRDWQVLTDVIFPLAKTVESIVLAVEYCKSRNLDVMKKMIHIVPMRRKNAEDKWEETDTIWPGIAEVRATATRTGIYAGRDAAIFGPMVCREFKHVDDRDGEIKKREALEFPEWCRVDIYKMVQGQRCKFEGPTVYWEEAYATESHFSEIPNTMWKERCRGQLEKCAEAASLRSAFPEETGGQLTSEEMAGRTLTTEQLGAGHYATTDDGTMTPPRPKQSDFTRPKAEVVDVEETPPPPKPEPASKPITALAQDGRPEPPPVGEMEIPDSLRKPQPEKAAPEPEADPAPEEQESSIAWDKACEMIGNMEKEMANVPDAELADYKSAGRRNIDAVDGLNDDQKDLLRGRFTSVILTEQQKRAKKGKKK